MAGWLAQRLARWLADCLTLSISLVIFVVVYHFGFNAELFCAYRGLFCLALQTITAATESEAAAALRSFSPCLGRNFLLSLTCPAEAAAAHTGHS